MTKDDSYESLFKEHSFEEIESVKDNLASEIDKRTELLKSIVKEKYRDIVETSDAIKSMKLNLTEIEQSFLSLDKCISEFYVKLKEPNVVESKRDNLLQSSSSVSSKPPQESDRNHTSSNLVKRLISLSDGIWESYDSGNLKLSVKLLNESIRLFDEAQEEKFNHNDQVIMDNLRLTCDRTREMIRKSLWHKIQTAAPDQVGIIAGSDQEDLYKLSLNSSIHFLVDKLRRGLSDTGFHASIKGYLPPSYFNSQTNEIEQESNLNPQVSYVQIPKMISSDLSEFLYGVCSVINTIAGFNLSRSSIVDSLRITIEHSLDVYTQIVPSVELLKAETKRRRAVQMYYDLLYLRILLNTSKNVNLIEKFDPKVTEVINRYEKMLDSIELYTISAALHSNVVSLSKSTIRLYGLLIPHLH